MKSLKSDLNREVIVEIVAHSKRQEMAEALREQVQADMTWIDDGFHGEWKNHLRAWSHAYYVGSNIGITHAVVLQDDAVPVEGFREALDEAIEQRPDDVLSLYTGTYRPRRIEVLRATKKADEEEASWLSADTLMWGVGVVIPVSLIAEMMKVTKESKLPYDQRIGYWCEKTGRPVYYTWPSLVDHADTPTVVKGHSKNQGVRVAHRTGVPEWNDIVVKVDAPNKNVVPSTRDRP